MDSSEEIGDYDNTTIGGIWSAFSWDHRDIQADDLPMMNSFAWPLGDCLNKTCLNGKFYFIDVDKLVINMLLFFHVKINIFRNCLHGHCKKIHRNR